MTLSHRAEGVTYRKNGKTDEGRTIAGTPYSADEDLLPETETTFTRFQTAAYFPDGYIFSAICRRGRVFSSSCCFSPEAKEEKLSKQEELQLARDVQNLEPSHRRRLLGSSPLRQTSSGWGSSPARRGGPAGRGNGEDRGSSSSSSRLKHPPASPRRDSVVGGTTLVEDEGGRSSFVWKKFQ